MRPEWRHLGYAETGNVAGLCYYPPSVHRWRSSPPGENQADHRGRARVAGVRREGRSRHRRRQRDWPCAGHAVRRGGLQRRPGRHRARGALHSGGRGRGARCERGWPCRQTPLPPRPSTLSPTGPSSASARSTSCVITPGFRGRRRRSGRQRQPTGSGSSASTSSALPHGIRAFVPRMIEQDAEGHIVNTSSVLGIASGGGPAIYGATKHARCPHLRGAAPPAP